MSGDGPPLLRPIPRRPFDLSLTSPTPPADDSAPSSPICLDGVDSRFLDARPAQETGSISRAQSVMNLTASTLFGIYSPTAWSRDRGYGEEPSTPWGTGAQTPVKRASVDETTYELMRDRSSLAGHAKSQGLSGGQPWTAAVVASLVPRAILLFGLGMGYGVLVMHLHREQDLSSFSMEGIIRPQHGYDWGYLVFWGFCGVALGGLLPWFDTVWEDSFGTSEATSSGRGNAEKEFNPETDWALVVRGVGAFVGIAFAIRKLSWASTMQASLTLALVNPFLWYLIDRSVPGFVFSAVVGLTGSAVVMGLNPAIIPAPTAVMSSSWQSNGTHVPGTEASPFGTLARQEMVEMAIWMVSVWFCSCLCFGNIGRRLAPSRTAAGRGRWGGVR